MIWERKIFMDNITFKIIVIAMLLIGLVIVYIICGWIGVAIFCHCLFWFIIGWLINYYIHK